MLSFVALPLLNRLLTQQAWARELLRPHAGKSAQLSLSGMRLAFRVAQDGALVAAPDAENIDVSIEVPASALPHLADGVGELSARARVSGDAGFAEAIGRLLRELRPDIGAACAPFVGNILANRIEQGLGTVTQFLQRASAGLRENALEYLRDESQLTIGGPELDGFARELAALRDDLSRLDKRIARL